MSTARYSRNRWLIFMLLGFLLLLFGPWASAQDHQTPGMEDMPGMDHGDMHGTAAPEDPAVVAKRLADKRESEFNHHVAGILIIIAGIFLLGQDRLSKRWPVVRYVWPMCFFVAGLFLLVFSDTEIWPFGPQTFWYAITHNVEDLQHKVFSVILLAIGCVEFQRARGRLQSAWAAWFFPVMGMSGALLLLFHVHSGNMRAPHAMETMTHIQHQHRWFSAVSFGISLTNGLAATPSLTQQFFKKVWPTLLIVLGILLMLYTE